MKFILLSCQYTTCLPDDRKTYRKTDRQTVVGRGITVTLLFVAKGHNTGCWVRADADGLADASL
jgi:hypothetical protein